MKITVDFNTTYEIGGQHLRDYLISLLPADIQRLVAVRPQMGAFRFRWDIQRKIPAAYIYFRYTPTYNVGGNGERKEIYVTTLPIMPPLEISAVPAPAAAAPGGSKSAGDRARPAGGRRRPADPRRIRSRGQKKPRKAKKRGSKKA